MLALAELAPKAFYSHDKTWGFLMVGIVCGTMILIMGYIAWTNFGPPAKRRAREANQN
jgi:hypothetical protein